MAAASPSTAITWTVEDGIAVVTLDRKDASVNTISRAVKDEFLVTFAALADDAQVRAVAFFSGKADNFIAGADIEEFVRLSSAAEAERLSADGQEMLDRIARFPKPVVVGIHGSCLGGGLEFALACQYRVATDHPKTQIGLPEIQLGILPGAGGCQRLPRLIGARAALDMILAGKVERAAKAFRIGIVDELVPPAILRSVTVQAARKMAGGWRPKRRHGGFVGWLLDGNPLGRSLVFRMARKAVLAKTGGHYPAPPAALEVVEYGLRHGMAAGFKREAEQFGRLAVTDVSRKLVQIFFATTQLKKDFGVAAGGGAPAAVRRVGVVGAGFMGAGIAGTAVVQASVDVRMKDADLPRVAAGLRTARENLDDRLKRRRITRFEHTRLVALLSGGDSYAGFGRADLVIEAVFEDLAVKQGVLREVEAATPDTTIFASNTSTIPITKIAEAARRPDRVVGMHFFSPVAKMPLLEVIPGAATAPATISAAVGFGRRMGKTVIVVKDSPGFWINRILGPYINEAAHLILEGIPIEEIDRVAVSFGFPVGPITLLDEVGLDVADKAAGVLHRAFGERLTPVPALQGLVKAGRLGRKAGKGFYRYQGGKKRGVDDSVYQALGVQPDDGGASRAADIVQRLVLMMINEAARATGEGVVRVPRDGDIGAIFGFGFPPFRGGPLRHADDLGAARVVADLERLAERHGARFAPCDVLQDQARRQSKFYP